MAVEQAYTGIRVLELGTRLSAGGCGSLLSQTGASVLYVSLKDYSSPVATKHDYRGLYSAGKSAVTIACDTQADKLRELVSASDVVITSHDTDPDWPSILGADWSDGKIVCDVSAFGRSGPLSGQLATDFEVQALTGLIDTTGDASVPPSRIAIPVTECLAALHAFGGIGAALRTLRKQGIIQDVEIALYDCAFAASASFLPKFIAEGKVPRRVGNRHPMTLPWNVYKSRDEWVLICTSSNDHWKRLADQLGDQRLIDDQELMTAAGRAKRADELDIAISKWVQEQSAEECVRTISQLSIPCATIAPLEEHPREVNLDHRGQICKLYDPMEERDVFVPGPVLRTIGQPGIVPREIPGRDGDCGWSGAPSSVREARNQNAERPLAGIRVVEVGPLTTGPLCGRMLASLGADVVKVEPPTGDAMRYLPPLKNGQGYFFSYYNTGKRAVALDLKQQGDRAQLTKLLAGADVLIQNLKEGAFARMGFTIDVMADINPRLVRCDISGFGQDSLYSGRPAVDSVVQAMSGIMTVNSPGDEPMKTGISFVDLEVAILSFGAVIAALERRDQTGKGVHLDLAMQDIASWSTQTFWNGAALPPASTVIACQDGRVIALDHGESCSKALGILTAGDGIDANLETEKKLAEVLAGLASARVLAAPLHSVADCLNHPQTVARDLHGELSDPTGAVWPAMRVPVGLSATPAHATHVIGPVGYDAAELLDTSDQIRTSEAANT
ncbi:MAG: CoA transferase [Pseudomonadota bacterium]